MAKENSVLAIDVGGAALKIAEFSVPESGGALVLERYALREFGEDLTDTGFIDAFEHAFKSLMAENAFTARSVRIAISSLNSFQRLSKLPPLMDNRAKATQVVEGEARQTVPYPLNEVVWDYQLIRHVRYFEVKPEVDAENPEAAASEAGAEPVYDTVEEMEALFVAVKDEFVTDIANIILDADLEILSVEISPTAVYNAAKANQLGEEACELIVDMGGRCSSLIFVDGGRVFLRAIPIAGNAITQQIAKEFSISFADAEEMKRKHCFVALGGAYEDSDSEVAATISKIARNVMTRLHGEINRSINVWKAQYGGNAPARILITGGSSIIPYVPHFLDEKLHLGVEFLNTFPVITISDAIDKEALLEVAHVFPPLIGLGVRHLKTCPVEINLIPKVVKAHRDLQQKKPFFYISAVCALLTVLIIYAGVTVLMNYNKKLVNLAADELQRTKEISEQIKKLSRQLGDVKGNYDGTRAYVDRRLIWDRLLNELQRITPPNMWFTRIDGISEYGAAAQAAAKPRPTPGMMMDGPPGMMMDDPSMMMAPAAPVAVNDVVWLRLQGHSLVLKPGSAEGVEDLFKKNWDKSDFFDKAPGSYVNPILEVDKGNNNLTAFVIYVKLKEPIKQ